MIELIAIVVYLLGVVVHLAFGIAEHIILPIRRKVPISFQVAVVYTLIWTTIWPLLGIFFIALSLVDAIYDIRDARPES